MRYKDYEIAWNENLNCYMVSCGWDGTLCFNTIDDAKAEIDRRIRNREIYQKLAKASAESLYLKNKKGER